MRLNKINDIWMFDERQSLARKLSEIVMGAVGANQDDFRKRDAAINAICPTLHAAIETAIESSVYAMACESMARQIVDVVPEGTSKRISGRELAEMQLKPCLNRDIR